MVKSIEQIGLQHPASFRQGDNQALIAGDLATRVSQEAWLDTLPGSIRRSDIFKTAHFAASEALSKTYPKAYVFPSDQIAWLDRTGHKAAYDALPADDSFLMIGLRSAGAKDAGREPYTEAQFIFQPPQTEFHPHIFIAGDSFEVKPKIEQNATLEYFLARNLIMQGIINSVTPKFPPYSRGIDEIIKNSFSTASENWQRLYPEANTARLDALVNTIESVIEDDSSPLIEVRGASIEYKTRFEGVNGGRNETIMEAGMGLDKAIVRFLANKPTLNALKPLAKLYTPENRQTAEWTHAQLLDAEKKEERPVRSFFGALGIHSYEDAFEAYSTSTIIDRFIAAKAKNPELVYPV